jgi:hypothetical protein
MAMNADTGSLLTQVLALGRCIRGMVRPQTHDVHAQLVFRTDLNYRYSTIYNSENRDWKVASLSPRLSRDHVPQAATKLVQTDSN